MLCCWQGSDAVLTVLQCSCTALYCHRTPSHPNATTTATTTATCSATTAAASLPRQHQAGAGSSRQGAGQCCAVLQSNGRAVERALAPHNPHAKAPAAHRGSSEAPPALPCVSVPCTPPLNSPHPCCPARRKRSAPLPHQHTPGGALTCWTCHRGLVAGRIPPSWAVRVVCTGPP
jgi:hypothetical protein